MNPYRAPIDVEERTLGAEKSAFPDRPATPEAAGAFLVLAGAIVTMMFGALVWIRLTAFSLDVSLFGAFAVVMLVVALVRKQIVDRQQT